MTPTWSIKRCVVVKIICSCWERAEKLFPWCIILISPVNSPHKGQWRGAFIFSLICARINGWVNNREDGSLRRHRTHYDVIVMMCLLVVLCWLTQIITDKIETVVGKQIWQTSDFLAFVNWRNITCRYMQIGDISKWVKICMFEMCLTKLIYSCT